MATAALPILLLPSSSSATNTTWKDKKNKNKSSNPFLLSSSSSIARRRGVVRINAFFNPLEEPLLKEALKEPVAFMGGMFAGLLRLDLNEDPLKEWIARTVEAAGITEEEISTGESKLEEDAPQQIEIE